MLDLDYRALVELTDTRGTGGARFYNCDLIIPEGMSLEGCTLSGVNIFVREWDGSLREWPSLKVGRAV